jgi:hypothetical protein
MISLSVEKNVVTLSVLGEFTLDDFRQFEEHVLYAAKLGPVNSKRSVVYRSFWVPRKTGHSGESRCSVH